MNYNTQIKYPIKIYDKNGNLILKYIDNENNRDTEYIPYEPYLFLDYQLPDAINVINLTEFKTNKPIFANKLSSIKKYYSIKKQLKDQGTKIYFDVPLKDQYFILNYYNKDIQTTKDAWKIGIYDIETNIGNEFPNPHLAPQPVTCYSFQDLVTGEINTYGTKPCPEIKNYKQFNSEDELLYKFWELVKEFDIVTGWNIKFFDNTYMLNRTLQKLGTNYFEHQGITYYKLFDKQKNEHHYKFKELNFIDYMEAYQIILRQNLTSYSLNNIAKLELNDSKISYEEDFENLDDLFHNDYKTYIEYNQKDVDLIKRIDENRNLIETLINLSYLFRCDLSDALSTVKPWENLAACKLLKTKRIPNYKSGLSVHKDYEGGYCFNRLNNNVTDYLACFDITSSYPNQTIAYNISPETIIEYDKLPGELKDIPSVYKNEDDILNNLDKFEKEVTPLLKKYNVTYNPAGYFYTREFLGFFPELDENLFNIRNNSKKESKAISKQLSKNPDKSLKIKLRNHQNIDKTYKTAIVSQYGATGSEYFHYFDVRLAESTTAGGRLSIKSAKKFIEENFGLDVEYIDTDSNYINVTPLTNKTNKDEALEELLVKTNEMLEKVNKNFERLAEIMNNTKPRISMENEMIVKKGLFKTKKMYILKYIWKDGIKKEGYKIRGINVIRSTSSEFMKENAQKIIDLIFSDATKDEIKETLIKLKKDFMNSTLEKISLRSGVSDLDKYTLGDKGIPIHVRASLVFNDLISKDKLKNKPIGNGTKMKYITVNKRNKYGTHVLGTNAKFDESILKYFQVDYETLWESSFFKPISDILLINKMNIKLNESISLF